MFYVDEQTRGLTVDHTDVVLNDDHSVLRVIVYYVGGKSLTIEARRDLPPYTEPHLGLSLGC